MSARFAIDLEFNFDQWIISNDITDLKEKLKQHGLINTQTIATTSAEFNSFISDPSVLSTKGHLLPKLFTAINKLSKQNTRFPSCPLIHQSVQGLHTKF